MALLATLAGTYSYADHWYEHYARAEAALAAQRWPTAVKELNEALQRKGDSGARERSYGMNVVAYFPYLKLGIAYYNLGQLDAALQAFDTEERLGAIRDAAAALAELQRYRRLVEDAKVRRAQDERQRIRRLVSENMVRAEQAEAQGRLADAVDAAARAAALAPEDQHATDLLERLRQEAARRDRERAASARADDLARAGGEALARGNPTEAASLLRQSLSLRPAPEVSALLGRAEGALRESAPRGVAGEGGGAGPVLARVQELEIAGKIDEALRLLQPLLARDPANGEAHVTLDRLLQAKRDAERRRALGAALTEAHDALDQRRFEEAIAAANGALAQESGNQQALELLRRAYGEISRRLVASAPAENLPPAIRFADLRETRADGSRTQRVRQPEFRLSGVVIDTSSVQMTFADQDERPLAGVVTSQTAGDYQVTEFSLQQRLRPGDSTFRLVATDAEGLSSSAEYRVQYVRPFYRAPWFPVLLLLPPGLVVAAIVTVRGRRRRALQRRRFNPFVAGAPVLDDDLFVGREELIRRVLQTVHNNSLLLFGERRIGKTSLQHHLKRRIEALKDPDFAFFPVLVDLQGTREERFFATVMEEIVDELEVDSGALRLAATRREGQPFEYRDFVHDLRLVFQTLSGRTEKKIKLVLLMDEVDELNAYDPRINQRLRSLFMRSFADQLVAVVSGVEIRRQWEKEGSPWYNFFEEIEVTPIDRSAVEELVTRPLRGLFEVEPGVVDRIVALTGGRPYQVQRLCVALVSRMHEGRRRRITVSDVEAVHAPRGS